MNKNRVFTESRRRVTRVEATRKTKVFILPPPTRAMLRKKNPKIFSPMGLPHGHIREVVQLPQKPIMYLRQSYKNKVDKRNQVCRKAKFPTVKRLSTKVDFCDSWNRNFEAPLKHLENPHLKSNPLRVQPSEIRNRSEIPPVIYPDFWKLGIYRDRVLTQVPTNNPQSALYKLQRYFGRIGSNPHFKFKLKCMVITGYTRGRLRALMRIRFLWLRGCKPSFLKAIHNMNNRVPRAIRDKVPLVFPRRVNRINLG